jgi:hypothetical protein
MPPVSLRPCSSRRLEIAPMPEKYQGHGYSLLYPETWTVEEDESGQAITLETPTGAFMTITPSNNLEGDFQMMLQMMEAEYDEVETEDCELELLGRSLQGITQRFVYLDLIVTSHVLKIDSGTQQWLIQIQGEDRELDQLMQVFAAVLTSMCQSLG